MAKKRPRNDKEQTEILALHTKYHELPEPERDAFIRGVVEARMGTASLEDAIRREGMVQPKDARVIIIAPNPALNLHLSHRTYEAGGAMGNLGSVFARHKVPTIVCGFLSRTHPAAELFRVLAGKRGVNTAHCTEIGNDCGINVYTDSDKKIRCMGPRVTEEERIRFLKYVEGVLDEINPLQPPVVVISGAVPSGERPEEMLRLHADVIHLVRRREARRDLTQPLLVVVDAREPYLYWAVINHPDYLKVTREELGQLLCTLFDRDDEFQEACRSNGLTRDELPEFAQSAPAIAAKYIVDHKGIPTVVVSGGSDGAWQVWRGSRKVIHCRANEELRESVWPAGAGDALVAAYVVGCMNAGDGKPAKIGTLEEGVAASYVTCTKFGSTLWSEYDEVIAQRRVVERQEFRLPFRVELRASQERLRTANDRIAEFLEACKIANTRPIVVADMDDTMTDAHQPIQTASAEAIAEVVECGITFTTLTSSSWPAVQRQFLDPIDANRALRERFRRLYQRMPILVNQGSLEHVWQGNVYRQRFSQSLRSYLGSKNLVAVNEILEQAIDRFHITSIKGDPIENRGTQITLYVLGSGATSEQKNEYYSRHGRGPRLEYAQWINERLRELGISAHASVGGKSSVDIAVVDKGFGIRRLAKSLGQNDLQSIIYFADEFGADSVDEPVARTGALSINVGPAIRDFDSPVWTTEQYGTTGFIEHMKQIADFLRR